MSKNETKVTTNNEFNFGLVTTTETRHTEKLGDVAVWTREWKNDKGEEKSITVTDKMIVLALENVEKLLQLKEFSSLGVCLELSEIAKVKEKLGMRSIAEIGEKWFHLKASTATQYARVGKYFVIKTVSEKGTCYRFIDDIEVAGGGNCTVTNLVQCLSLIDDKADDPTALFYQSIADGKLHIGGTLAEVKKEVKAIKGGSDTDVIGDVEGKEISSEKVETKADISKAFSEILTEIEKFDDDKKARAIELIGELQALFA